MSYKVIRKLMATGKRSMAEEWFIRDALEERDELCPMCRKVLDAKLVLFGDTTEAALSEVYKLSRAIRVDHVISGRFDAARRTSDYEALRVMDTIGFVIDLSSSLFTTRSSCDIE